MPAFMAAVGRAGLELDGRRRRRARRRGVSTPKIARATSLRPAPTRPASATISPRRTSKDDVDEHALAREAVDLQDRLADLGVAASGTAASSSRPTMRRTSSSVVMSSVSPSWVTSPSRRTVTVSQIVKISSRRWEMKSTAAPRSLAACGRRRTGARPRGRTAPRSARP